MPFCVAFDPAVFDGAGEDAMRRGRMQASFRSQHFQAGGSVAVGKGLQQSREAVDDLYVGVD